MKILAILCFLFLASACTLAVRAEEEKQQLDAPQNDDQPEAPVNFDEETTEESDEATDDDEISDEEVDEEISDEENSDEENNDEENNDDETNDEEETENDEDDDQELENQDEEKQGRIAKKCRTYRKGLLRCIACGCRRVCRPKLCTRRICLRRRRRVCGKRRVCRLVRRPKLLKRPVKVGSGYAKNYVTYTQYYRVRVCRSVPKYCLRRRKCLKVKRPCGKRCGGIKCAYRRCNKLPVHPSIKG